MLREAFPPRSDRAQKVTWDLAEVAGRRVVFEAVDGDDGSAYAWMAVGQFEGGSVNPPAVAPANVVARQVAAAEIAGFGGNPAPAMIEALTRLARRSDADPVARASAVRGVSEDPVLRAAARVPPTPVFR